MIRVVLFDLDGVIRHFDPDHLADIERRHGLAAGTIAGIAFANPLIEEVTTGRITRAEWVRQVSEAAGSAPAAEEWGVQPSVVDESLLALSDEIRSLGLTTAVLTNGTDTIPAEIAALGIADRFDAIFNSADIGFVKPDVRAFGHVLDALEVTGAEVFFTDDTASKLVGADRLSMCTHVFAGVEDLRDQLIAAGVGVRRMPVAPHREPEQLR
ncbi:HAD family hydrolase [Agromyces cerinus]|uniref:Putative hydrolase of the HAD superfamily n=1 Tax=Agromyces cerinus subsp. cerinus TaxID=232089 RepID=A0A1N6I5I7_9MICO|nr:HAD family hydrolase [Agromyces cerinus]SIO27270.1 putative hydrolase of the HAD superfamily [Agromyces cerinus subsp. cerinus]